MPRGARDRRRTPVACNVTVHPIPSEETLRVGGAIVANEKKFTGASSRKRLSVTVFEELEENAHVEEAHAQASDLRSKNKRVRMRIRWEGHQPWQP